MTFERILTWSTILVLAIVLLLQTTCGSKKENPVSKQLCDNLLDQQYDQLMKLCDFQLREKSEEVESTFTDNGPDTIRQVVYVPDNKKLDQVISEYEEKIRSLESERAYYETQVRLLKESADSLPTGLEVPTVVNSYEGTQSSDQYSAQWKASTIGTLVDHSLQVQVSPKTNLVINEREVDITKVNAIMAGVGVFHDLPQSKTYYPVELMYARKWWYAGVQADVISGDAWGAKAGISIKF
jgi:hypothetical protein